MVHFPGFPSNDFDFHFEEAGGALAGLLARSSDGEVVPGILTSVDLVLSFGAGWTIRVAPFVSVRSKGRSVLLGGMTEEVVLDVEPSPNANSRIDVIYSLPADVSAGDPIEGVSIRTGTPGASPVKPSIPEGAIEIGTLRLAAGASSAAQGAMGHTYTEAAVFGGMVGMRTKAQLDALSMKDGSFARVIADKRVYVATGGSWRLYTSEWLPLQLLRVGGRDTIGMKPPEAPMCRMLNGALVFKGGIDGAGIATGSSSDRARLPAEIPSYGTPSSGPAIGGSAAAMGMWLLTLSGTLILRTGSAASGYYKLDGLSVPAVSG